MIGGKPIERTRFEVSWEDQTVSARTAEDVDDSYTETTNKTQECENINDTDSLIEKLVTQQLPKGTTRRVQAYKVVETLIFDEVA